MDLSESLSVALSGELSASLFSDVPKKPGVYWFKNASGEVLYVGKAKSLANRLKSYTRTEVLSRTRKMVSFASEVNFTILGSEIEALLLEAELVRLYQPHYNIRLKDDKSPLYIAITREKSPRVLSVRKTNLSQPKNYLYHFGPYASGGQVRKLLKLLRKMFPYCNQRRSTKNTACFYVHLGLCPGACCGQISEQDYNEQIRNIEQFLRGKSRYIVSELKSKLTEFSKSQEFEKAGLIKRQIETIEYVMAHRRILSDRSPLPNLDSDERKHKLLLLKRFLQHVPGINTNPLKRIETYDVSNLEGKQATASMVVFVNGRADNSLYRHFRIKTIDQPNDPGMLAEALRRRQNHSEWGIPDLILIDGGKTQLNAANEAVTWSVPVVSLAKNPDRLMMQNPDTESEDRYIIIRLKKNHPASQLLQHMRDESHRFAKRYHSKLYGKSLVSG